jgi:hypothetical protein
MTRSLFLALILCISLIAADAPDKPVAPKSPAAVQAIKRSDLGLKKALADYRAAKMATYKQLIVDLKVVQDSAMTNKNLGEATACKNAIDDAQAAIDRLVLEAKGPTYSLWHTTWSGGEAQNWLKAGGIVINARGEKGTWQMKGSQLIVRWPNSQDDLTVSEDGKLAEGKNQRGDWVKYTLVGTDIDGAPAPPSK